MLGQVQPTAVEFAEGAAFDVGSSSKQLAVKVNLVEGAQAVQDNQVRVKVEDALKLLRKVACSKQAVVHLGGVAVGNGSVLQQVLRHLNIYQLGAGKQGRQ